MTMPDLKTHAPPLDDAFEAELERMALAVNEPEPPPPLESMRGGGLARYAAYQARDFLKYRASVMFGLAMLALWILHYNFAEFMQDAEFRVLTDPFPTLTTMGALAFGTLGTLFSTAGIVSRDREGGYQRFLLAKPVRAARFYLQSFVINGLGLLAVTALTLLVMSVVFAHAMPFVVPLAIVAAIYVAVGGLAFLLSTLVRYEIVLALVSVPLSILLFVAGNDGYWWAAALSWLLPPMHRLAGFIPTVVTNTPGKVEVVTQPFSAMIQAVLSLVVYGAAYIAAGVAVIKKRSIIR